MLAESVMGQNPFSGHLFVFFNRRGDRCKILPWDRTGFCIWCKRLEAGTFERPKRRSDDPGGPGLEVDVCTLAWILEGIDLVHAGRRKRYTRRMARQAGMNPSPLSRPILPFFKV
jgi:transposase